MRYYQYCEIYIQLLTQWICISLCVIGDMLANSMVILDHPMFSNIDNYNNIWQWLLSHKLIQIHKVPRMTQEVILLSHLMIHFNLRLIYVILWLVHLIPCLSEILHPNISVVNGALIMRQQREHLILLHKILVGLSTQNYNKIIVFILRMISYRWMK